MVWYAKNWNSTDAGKKDKLLIEQTYPGEHDIRMHYEYVLKAFRDHRYIMQDGKPIFVIFAPHMLPENYPLIKLWNEWAIMYLLQWKRWKVISGWIWVFLQ